MQHVIQYQVLLVAYYKAPSTKKIVFAMKYVNK
jgi:hypothetical protein